ncbi:hypothetical protein Sste5346_010145 [Sporothrix stenoceras]|uniref:Uncharacterized protein n=1 Tax=Sporothrix stenoceras TaxID=5173 RepID=A0ABR3YHD1_9PEZI
MSQTEQPSAWLKSLEDKATAKGVLPFLKGTIWPVVYSGNPLQLASSVDHWNERAGVAQQIVLDALCRHRIEYVWPEWRNEDPQDMSAPEILSDIDDYWFDTMRERAQYYVEHLQGTYASNYSDPKAFLEAFDWRIQNLESTGRKMPDSTYAGMLLRRLSNISFKNWQWVEQFRRDKDGKTRNLTYEEVRTAARDAL